MKVVRLALALAMALPSQSIAASGELLTIDVSGRSGTDSMDGSNGMRGSSGSDGRDGGHATEATKGQSAGVVGLKIGEGTKGVLVIQADVVDANGAKKNVNQQIRIGTEGYIYLKAAGGRGGKGGNGGNGGDGGDGSNGSDATRYSSGSNGQDGGDGGNAGRGSSGKDAGDGGKIVVELPADQTKLLMLLMPDVSAGKGGRGGSHGTPGQGGSGGRGGSSYSWSEQVSDGTDSNGNTTYRTESGSNSGGSNGSSGSRGQSASGPLVDGKDGKTGSHLIRLSDGREFKERYDLALVDYEIVLRDKDGVIEPGEVIDVKNIRIRNTGGMPTPPNTPIRLTLANGDFTVAEQIEILVKESIAPGDAKTISTEHLTFRVKNNILAKAGEERARWADRVRPLADLTDVERPFTNFDNTKSIEITYPIEIEPIQTLRSLAPGQASKFYFTVKNVSGRDFGGESEMKRAIETLVRRSGGDLSSSDLTFHTKDGQPLDLNEGILRAVKNLKAGQSNLIEGIVSLSANAEFYKGGEISTRLELQKIEDASKQTTIQERKLSIRVAQTYVKSPNSDVLFITNSETTMETVKAMREMLAGYGMKADIWDLPTNATLDLQRALENGSTLMDDFKGKTIIVLNDSFKAVDQAMRAQEFLSRRDFVKATAEKGIGFLFLGSNPNESLLHSFLMPQEGTNESRFPSVKKFMKAQRADVEVAEAPRPASAFLDQFRTVDVNRMTLWGQPKESTFTAIAGSLRDRMMRLHPERNYVIVQSFQPEMLKKGFLGLGKTWRLGEIEIRRTLDAGMGPGVALDIDASAIRSGSFAAGPEVPFALMMALSFDAKVSLFERMLGDRATQDEKKLSMLSDAILADLLFEQTKVRESLRLGFSSRSKVRESLVNLNRLTKIEAKLATADSQVAKDAVTRIVAAVAFVAKKEKSIWDYLMPLRVNADVAAVTSELANKVLKSAFESGRVGRTEASYQAKIFTEMFKSQKRKTVPKAETARRIVEPIKLNVDSTERVAPEVARMSSRDARKGIQAATRAGQSNKTALLAKSVGDQRSDMLVSSPTVRTCKSLF